MSSKTAAAKADESSAEAAPEAAAPFAPMLRDRWKARESGVFWNEHECNIEAGTPPEHLMRSEYWANIAHNFKPGDNIIAMVEDCSWRLELTVWETGRGWARVAPREAVAKRPDFSDVPAGKAENFEASWGGPQKKFRVIRKSDRAEVKSNFPSIEDARRWIADHLRTLAK